MAALPGCCSAASPKRSWRMPPAPSSSCADATQSLRATKPEPLETPMLIIPLEKLAFIIVKAREYDAEVSPVDEESGSNPSDDADRDVLEDSPDNPTYQELVDAITGLSELERIELLAL